LQFSDENAGEAAASEPVARKEVAALALQRSRIGAWTEPGLDSTIGTPLGPGSKRRASTFPSSAYLLAQWVPNTGDTPVDDSGASAWRSGIRRRRELTVAPRMTEAHLLCSLLNETDSAL
jgi:hypothetical protein